MKTCCKCKKEKCLSEFYRDKSRKDGYTYRCKRCHDGQSEDQERRVRSKPSHAREGSPSLYKNLSEDGRERERIRKKQWKKDHPEVVSAINRRVYVKRKKVLVEASAKETREFMENNTFCVRCGSTDDLTLDHVIPISWGVLSRHALDNFQVLCNVCNATKNSHVTYDLREVETPDDFDIRNLLT